MTERMKGEFVSERQKRMCSESLPPICVVGGRDGGRDGSCTCVLRARPAVVCRDCSCVGSPVGESKIGLRAPHASPSPLSLLSSRPCPACCSCCCCCCCWGGCCSLPDLPERWAECVPEDCLSDPHDPGPISLHGRKTDPSAEKTAEVGEKNWRKKKRRVRKNYPQCACACWSDHVPRVVATVAVAWLRSPVTKGSIVRDARLGGEAGCRRRTSGGMFLAVLRLRGAECR